MVSPAPEVLAIIPARGGSKSIPRKNVRLLGGHPLVAYSIVAALSSTRVSRVIVSTDDEEIAAIARLYGAEVPFLRPAALALDDTPDLPLFQHALEWLRSREEYAPDIVVQLRPTSPLRPHGLVDRAVELLLDNSHADSVRAVTSPGQNPYKMWKLAEDGYLGTLLALNGLHEPYNMPRQALPQVLWQTGHVDVIRRQTISEQGSLTGARILPVPVDRRYSVDIDTDADWRLAEWLLGVGGLDVVTPRPRTMTATGAAARALPERVALLVMDFDGVMTDDRVLTDEHGVESVACHRGDGLGLEMLARAGVPVVVLSREANPVVAARCRKLGIECHQAVTEKGAAFRELLAARRVSTDTVVYLGNDVTDICCLRAAGCGVAVADAHPDVIACADLVLHRQGGHGAVRELCDAIIEANSAKESVR